MANVFINIIQKYSIISFGTVKNFNIIILSESKGRNQQKGSRSENDVKNLKCNRKRVCQNIQCFRFPCRVRDSYKWKFNDFLKYS